MRAYLCGCVVWLACCGVAAAQDSPGGNPAAPASDAPPGLRFTPAMARGIVAKIMPGLKQHYQLPDDKKDEAAEKLTRRIMEMAHAMDGKAQKLVERYMEEKIGEDAEGGRPGSMFMPRGFGKEFAERVLEITPAIKDFMRNFVQDLRPMLPIKQQLKMAGEMMAANTGLDTFEKTMQKWASGEVTEFGNPFVPDRPVKKDESGQSEELKNARKTAQEQLDKFAFDEWDRYLKQFKEFYELDEAQCATADSMLREFKQRAEQRKRDEGWRTRYYENRLWLNIFWRVPDSWGSHPVQVLLQDDHDDATSWLDSLSAEFKARLETVPIESQRKRAEERVDKLLQDKGIVLKGGDK